MTATAQFRSRFRPFAGRTTRHLLAAALLLLLLLCSNPLAAQNAPETVTIKLPYDGPDMRFKAVHLGIDGKNFFASRKVKLGSREGNSSYKEWSKPVSLAGAFIGQRNGTSDWLYYLGETEVSQGQWNSVIRWMDEQEGKTSTAKKLTTERATLPQTEITVAEIYRFIEGLNTWMLQNQKNNLPKLGQSYAFCRLPTEAEWAFAARGGISILEKDSDRFDRPHPYGEDLGKYEWHRGNTNSEVKECGSKYLQPNPIGLQDMLGNVEEFTLSLFSPEYKQGRFGQLVIRGNSSQNSPEDFAVSRRTEFASHNATGQLIRPKRVGFRLALSSAVSSSAKPEKLDEDCKKYMSSDDRHSGSSAAALAEQNSREQTKKVINSLESNLREQEEKISLLQERRKKDQENLLKTERINREVQHSNKRLEAKVADLQERLDARPEPDTLKQQLRQAEVDKQNLKDRLQHEQEKLKKLEQKVSSGIGETDYQELYTVCEKHVTQFMQEAAECKGRIAAAPPAEKVKNYQLQLGSLEDQKKVLAQELAEQKAEQKLSNKTMQERARSLEGELDQSKQKIADLERRQFDSEDKIAENAKLAKIAEKRYLEALMRQASANAYLGFRLLTKREAYLTLPQATKERDQAMLSEASQMIHDYWHLVVEMAEKTKAEFFPEVKQNVEGWLRDREKTGGSVEQRKALNLIERHFHTVRSGRSLPPDDLVQSFTGQAEFR